MVCGARSGSSSGRRSSRGRVFAASTSGSSSVPLPLAAGEFTPPPPRVTVVGPSSVPPPLPAGSGEFTPPPPRVAGSCQSTPSPPTIAGPSASAPPAFLAGASTVPEAEDVVSLQEGGGSLYDSTLRESNHRLTRRSDEAQSRLVWTTTARSNFKHLLYNARKNTHKVCQSADPTLWRERAPTWMMRDYWESLCNIWAADRWQQTSTTMKVNRASNPKANMHTSGSVFFATHQSRLKNELKWPSTFQEVFDKTHKKNGTDQYISDKAREVAESYSQQMTEKYAEEEEQPQLDLEVWVAAYGALKKGHVYGLGHSMDTSKVLSSGSSSSSQTSAFTTPSAPVSSGPAMESRLVPVMQTQVSDAVQAQLSQALSQALSQVSIPP
ncbi:hypothetical protein Taro_036415 [Colocasia esculenta]|uniref:Uncharacterized protein n=1 Tax=Colocasia esculenta TaxID=4460 RepID=A0A843W310_COLES|nr:hypothetical protein [Colocasia esculenta]